MFHFVKIGLLAATFLLVCVSESFPQVTVSIQGTVKDRTGAVVAGATLAATNVDTNFAKNTTTDSDGYYIFRQMPTGRYKIKLVSSGFMVMIREVTASPGQALSVDFILGEEASRKGDLTGIVTDRNKNVITDLKISITNKETNETSVISTDSKGKYRINDLAPGLYRIEFEVEGYRKINKEVRIRSGKLEKQNFRLKK
jgi:iron complex outermembrane recepter protein